MNINEAVHSTLELMKMDSRSLDTGVHDRDSLRDLHLDPVEEKAIEVAAWALVLGYELKVRPIEDIPTFLYLFNQFYACLVAGIRYEQAKSLKAPYQFGIESLKNEFADNDGDQIMAWVARRKRELSPPN